VRSKALNGFSNSKQTIPTLDMNHVKKDKNHPRIGHSDLGFEPRKGGPKSWALETKAEKV